MQAQPGRDALHHADDGLAAVKDGGNQPQGAGEDAVGARPRRTRRRAPALPDAPEVGASAEVLSRAAQDHDADVGIGAVCAEQLDQQVALLGRQCIGGIGAVQGDPRDAVLHLVQHHVFGLFGHHCLLAIGAPWCTSAPSTDRRPAGPLATAVRYSRASAGSSVTPASGWYGLHGTHTVPADIDDVPAQQAGSLQYQDGQPALGRHRRRHQRRGSGPDHHDVVAVSRGHSDGAVTPPAGRGATGSCYAPMRTSQSPCRAAIAVSCDAASCIAPTVRAIIIDNIDYLPEVKVTQAGGARARSEGHTRAPIRRTCHRAGCQT